MFTYCFLSNPALQYTNYTALNLKNKNSALPYSFLRTLDLSKQNLFKKC